MMAGYSGTPLARKLGIKEGYRVSLVGAPDGFRRELAGLPKGVEFVASIQSSLDLILFFAKTASELRSNFPRLAAKLAPAGMLWIAWPKKASGVPTDLSDGIVRSTGLEAGLVDTKVCAVNEVWSGLKFVIRVKDRPKTPRKADAARASVGFRVKSGRAIAVLLTCSPQSLTVVERREIKLCDESVPDSSQPYHAALDMPNHKAAKAVERLVEIVKRATRSSVSQLLKEWDKAGNKLNCAGLVVGSLTDPASIGNDHVRAHALEGHLFRTAVGDALAEQGLSPVVVTERDVYAKAATVLSKSADELKRVVSEGGRSLGGPWRVDEKTAALAAWMAALTKRSHPS